MESSILEVQYIQKNATKDIYANYSKEHFHFSKARSIPIIIYKLDGTQEKDFKSGKECDEKMKWPYGSAAHLSLNRKEYKGYYVRRKSNIYNLNTNLFEIEQK